VLAIGFGGEHSRGIGRPNRESDHLFTASVAALGEDQPSADGASGGRNSGAEGVAGQLGSLARHDRNVAEAGASQLPRGQAEAIVGEMRGFRA
jgi:hypothetical protein